MQDISIIIPIASWEMAWRDLAKDLAGLPKDIEIVFVVSKQDLTLKNQPPQLAVLAGHNVKWLRSDNSGRAQQLNAGAREAKGKFLWFLHADSRFSPEIMDELDAVLEKNPGALHYFHLRFLNDGPPLIFINQWGANIRSCLFGVPFGDQGFCISKALFEEIGGYPEDVEYGEDHLFVWHARQHGVAMRPVKASILTSARKYKHKGWLNLTLQYQQMWIKQAWPELKKLFKGKNIC